MTPDQLAELKTDATLRKRLAKKMAHDCFRNTILEDWEQNGVEDKHRIQVIEITVRKKQHVATERQGAQRNHGAHGDMLTSFMPSASAFFGVFGGLLFAGPRWSGTQLILRIWWDGCALPQRLSRFPAAWSALSRRSLGDRGTPSPGIGPHPEAPYNPVI
jgi:hypothetical protein